MKHELNEIERIKSIIHDAEIASAKNDAMIEKIESEWLEKFNTKDVKEIKKKLLQLQAEYEKAEKEYDELCEKLFNACDWDELEEELE